MIKRSAGIPNRRLPFVLESIKDDRIIAGTTVRTVFVEVNIIDNVIYDVSLLIRLTVRLWEQYYVFIYLPDILMNWTGLTHPSLYSGYR